MALKTLSEGGRRELPEPGMYPMVITGVIDVGMQTSMKFGTQPKVIITMELSGTVMSDGRPFVLPRTFTLTLHQQGNLLPFLEALRGRPIPPEERGSFDLTRIAGKPGRVVVSHHPHESGRTFANVVSVLPPEPGQPTTTISPVLIYDRDEPDPAVYARLPEWIQNQIDSAAPVGRPEPMPATPAPDFEDDLSF